MGCRRGARGQGGQLLMHGQVTELIFGFPVALICPAACRIPPAIVPPGARDARMTPPPAAHGPPPPVVAPPSREQDAATGHGEVAAGVLNLTGSVVVHTNDKPKPVPVHSTPESCRHHCFLPFQSPRNHGVVEAVRRRRAGCCRNARRTHARRRRPAPGRRLRDPAPRPGQGPLPPARRVPAVALSPLRPGLRCRARRAPRRAPRRRRLRDAHEQQRRPLRNPRPLRPRRLARPRSGSGARRRRDDDADDGERVGGVHGDRLICVAEGAGVNCRLLDPSAAAAAGAAARALPRGLAEEHAAHERDVSHHTSMVALGQVASTGERKVLRVLDLFPGMARQLYELITLDGGGDSGGGRWRKATAPAHIVGFGTWTAIDQMVYFFSSEFVQGQDVMPDRIASFDLGTEQWRPTIRGPVSSSLTDDVGGHPINHLDWGEFSLAAMNGSLVMTHRVFPSSMDLWFLMDEEKGLWVKKHVLQLSISYQHGEHTVRPLLVLDDGRIVLVHLGNRGSLKIYDPRTSSSTDVAELGPCVAVGLYAGSVLSLANGASS